MNTGVPLKSLLLVILFLGVSTRCQAQSLKPGEEKTLTATDGWPLRITYYESNGDKESPVAILIPGAEGLEDSRTRKVWDGVARALQKEKYAVVTADLRKHGDSIPPVEDEQKAKFNRLSPADYQAMAAIDLETIKEFLLNEHKNQKLNIRKLGIATAGSSCLVASTFAAADWLKLPWNDAPAVALKTPRGQDVRAIMMLSPASTVRGLSLPDSMKVVCTPAFGVAINIYYNPSDRREQTAAEKVFRYAELKGEDPDGARQLLPGPPDKVFSAEGLLEGRAAPVMEKKIVEFFDKFVKDRPEPWRTRESKL